MEEEGHNTWTQIHVSAKAYNVGKLIGYISHNVGVQA